MYDDASTPSLGTTTGTHRGMICSHSPPLERMSGAHDHGGSRGGNLGGGLGAPQLDEVGDEPTELGRATPRRKIGADLCGGGGRSNGRHECCRGRKKTPSSRMAAGAAERPPYSWESPLLPKPKAWRRLRGQHRSAAGSHGVSRGGAGRGRRRGRWGGGKGVGGPVGSVHGHGVGEDDRGRAHGARSVGRRPVCRRRPCTRRPLAGSTRDPCRPAEKCRGARARRGEMGRGRGLGGGAAGRRRRRATSGPGFGTGAGEAVQQAAPAEDVPTGHQSGGLGRAG